MLLIDLADALAGLNLERSGEGEVKSDGLVDLNYKINNKI